MKSIAADQSLVAYCGLYCGACSKYLKDKCPGCHLNEKATWCKVKSCCEENSQSTCGECQKHTDIMDCKAFNNIFSKFFGFVFKSDRKACIQRINDIGIKDYAEEMAASGEVSLKKI